MDHDSGAPDRESMVSRAIKAVLDRHGVPERQRLSVLEAATEMSYQQVRRRMMGETPWNADEIKRLASHFGEPMFKLLGALVDDVGRPGTLMVGGVGVPCTIWIGPAVAAKSRVAPLVAIADDATDQWIVVPLGDAGQRKAFEVKRLVFEAAPAKRVAVLEADEERSAGLCRFLRDKGLDAVAWRTAEHLGLALETARFDGFILDWMLGDGAVRRLLPTLRARNPDGPVIILTDRVEAGGAQEEELAATISAYRAHLYERPASMLSLFNALELGFDSSPAAGR